MTLETGKPIGKDFLYNFLFKKDILPPFSSELIQIFLFSEAIPLSPLTTKIRLMRPLQEEQDIGQPRLLRNEEHFYQAFVIIGTTSVEDSED